MNYRGFTLDRFQTESIEALDAGHSVLVAAPTGTGKTIIADWIVEQALKAGKDVIYTAPIKALSNQKFRDYIRLHGEKNVGLVTGDLVIRRDAPCRVMTTEVLRNMLLAGEKLPDLAAVILDEIHFLDDRDRGTVWEEVLIYLPKTVQIVGLSATLSNLHDFAEWLEEVRDCKVVTVTEHERTVPLTIRYASVDTQLAAPPDYAKIAKRKGRKRPQQRGGRGRGNDRRNRGRRGSRKTSHLHIFDMLEEEELLPYLYFVFSRRETEIKARKLGDHTGGLLDDDEASRLRTLLDERAAQLGPALDPEIRALYQQGIAFHHAGLHVQLKALVEELYESKLIKVLYCTSTFALGINMPARTVVFDGLKKYDGRGFNPLPTREFMQMAGRAGRRGLDDVGHVIVRLDIDEFPDFQPNLERYHRNRVEPVRSSFNLSWNSVVNLLDRHPPDRCREIVEKSFLNWWRARQAAQSDPQADKYKRRIQKRARRNRHRCWEEFQNKVGFLEHIGYLDEDGSFNAGARLLKNLQMSEILVCELILEGVFEGLKDAELFGVLASITNNLPRHVKPNHRPRGTDSNLQRRIARVRMSPIVADAESMSNEQYPFDPSLITLGRAWANGDSLQDVLMMVHSDTDISGDLITGFRRAKDLAGQLREAFREDDGMVEQLTGLIRTVSRDEVEVVG